jgi:hypothetical protein
MMMMTMMMMRTSYLQACRKRLDNSTYAVIQMPVVIAYRSGQVGLYVSGCAIVKDVDLPPALKAQDHAARKLRQKRAAETKAKAKAAAALAASGSSASAAS